MKLKKIFDRGKMLNENLYRKLISLDNKIFQLGKFEFKENRIWWVIEQENKIVAYCGMAITHHNECYFNRAWVDKDYRGLGIHKKMIDVRVNNAKNISDYAITYTDIGNCISAHNLIKKGFLMYRPEFQYVGKDFLYFKKRL